MESAGPTMSLQEIPSEYLSLLPDSSFSVLDYLAFSIPGLLSATKWSAVDLVDEPDNISIDEVKRLPISPKWS
jgi:hypothetical protein